MLLKVLLIVGVVRLFIVTEKPALCAGIYAGLVLVLTWLTVSSPVVACVVGALVYLVCYGYFWALSRLEGAPWWIVFFVGIVVLLFF